MREKKMPSGAKALIDVPVYGTAEAVPFLKDCVFTQTLQPVTPAATADPSARSPLAQVRRGGCFGHDWRVGIELVLASHYLSRPGGV
jgi:hypothetical protein